MEQLEKFSLQKDVQTKSQLIEELSQQLIHTQQQLTNFIAEKDLLVNNLTPPPIPQETMQSKHQSIVASIHSEKDTIILELRKTITQLENSLTHQQMMNIRTIELKYKLKEEEEDIRAYSANGVNCIECENLKSQLREKTSHLNTVTSTLETIQLSGVHSVTLPKAKRSNITVVSNRIVKGKGDSKIPSLGSETEVEVCLGNPQIIVKR